MQPPTDQRPERDPERTPRARHAAGLKLFAAVTVFLSAPPVGADERPLSFNNDIRPILSNNCFFCHGPDERKREADLRLDTAEGSRTDLGGYAAIVPGDPDASEIIARIVASDPDEVMPPPATKKSISAEEVALLRRWIEEGAEYEPHWAFKPIEQPSPPLVEAAEWPRNAIDRFVLAALEERGLHPSPEADRRTLIRRASLDLTGLLPMPDEVEAFVADDSPDAWERLVDRLLDSPHFGEKWGRHWLDQARYADSNGYTIDSARTMWPYRDWVIGAFNADMPFDQFTVAQLAGDLLPNATTMQRVASAFHRNTLINEEGGTDDEQFRNEGIVDRVNTTGAVWLGLTLSCAQCHTHKFDPIPQKEYFQLFAFFNQGTDVNNRGAVVEVTESDLLGATPSSDSLARLEALRTRAAELEAGRDERRAAWENGALAAADNAPSSIEWISTTYESYATESNAGFALLEDNSLLADGHAKANDAYRITIAPPADHPVAAVQLRVIPHESLPSNGPGTAGNGNFVLSEFEVHHGDAKVPLKEAFASHAQNDYPVRHAIDGRSDTGWAINVAPGSNRRMNAEHTAWFVLAEPLPPGSGPVTIVLRHERNPNYLIGRFALEVAATAPESAPDDPQRDRLLVDALGTPANQRTKPQQRLLDEAFARADTESQQVSDEIRRLEESTLGARAELMVMNDLPPAQRRQTFLHRRGDFLNPDRELGPLEPGVLSVLHPMRAEPAADPATLTRLDLAEWLTDPANPLTPRVTVNRIWMRCFGNGIVETENDFGTQGTPPTHPELLDWLSARFIENGWSTKSLLRLITTSATYRQASHHRSDLAEIDPRNQLLGRQARLRLEAEYVRDAALSASGLLERRLGGPPVFPPQPDGVYAFTQNRKSWDESKGGDRYRRSLYTMFYRSAPYPFFTTFDSPDFTTTCTRRTRSNTPLQALTLANDTTTIELARGLAASLVQAGDAAFRDRLDMAFRACYSRPPTAHEAAALQAFHQSEEERYRTNPERARALLGQAAVDGDAPGNAQRAAWTALARVLMNTDEFITRE